MTPKLSLKWLFIGKIYDQVPFYQRKNNNQMRKYILGQYIIIMSCANNKELFTKKNTCTCCI